MIKLILVAVGLLLFGILGYVLGQAEGYDWGYKDGREGYLKQQMLFWDNHQCITFETSDNDISFFIKPDITYAK